MTSFRQIRKFLAPRWLTDGEGGLIGYSLDLIKDAFLERLRLGHLVRFPQQGPDGTPAPPDALSAMGNDRRVVRGINEDGASYSRRLLAWLDDRKTAGNPFTLMRKLAEYTGDGCVFKTVDNSGNWFILAADGTRSLHLKQANWDWDGNTAKWSRFWVIIHPPATLWTTGATFADGTKWGDAKTWGTTATREQVQTVRSIVADWKPAGTRCVNIIVALDPASFDYTAAVDSTGMPDGLWGHWSKKVAGVQVPARLATARYWDGTS
jgi:hypothetical protein